MKLITRDADYAVKAISLIAKEKRSFNANELVSRLGIPRAFLRRILQKLSASGILMSSKGKNGGFLLAKRAKDIKVADIITAFQGKISVNECMFKKRLCPNRSTCPLRKEILKIEKDVVARLNNITINTLMKGNKR